MLIPSKHLPNVTFGEFDTTAGALGCCNSSVRLMVLLSSADIAEGKLISLYVLSVFREFCVDMQTQALLLIHVIARKKQQN
jgi:hypothetical protein